MPYCVVCKEHFSVNIKIDGKVRNLCKRKRCLKCNPFGNKSTRINPTGKLF